MEQGEARRRAQELGGIAVEARPRPGGGWLVGGWTGGKDATWIVTDVHRREVLAP